MTRILLPLLLCSLTVARLVSAQEAALKPEDVLGQDRLITLKEAIELGLQYNLGLQVIREEPALARERVRESWGLWEPNLTAGYERAHAENPITSNLQAFLGTTGDRTVDNIENGNVGLIGVLPWGLSYNSFYSNNRISSNSGLYAFKPQYAGLWTNQLVLPLLRGLYWGDVDLLVRRSNVQREISDANFQQQLTDGVFQLESAYWNLSATRALERSTQQAVDTANDLLEQTKVQYQVGTVSKVLVTQAEANLAQREADHISAANDAERAQDNLLTVILSPGINDYGTTTVRTEEPTFVDYAVDANEALEKAHVRRPELLAAQKTVEDADISKRYAWNQKLPNLDITGSYSNNGVSGTQKTPPGVIIDPNTRQGFPSSRAISATRNNGPDGIPNTADDTFSDLVFGTAIQPDLGFRSERFATNDRFWQGNGFHGYGVRADFSFPIGNDTADARYTQRKIELRRATTTLRRTEQDVVLDVRTAVRELQSSIDSVKAAQRARIASEETLRAEEERLRLGDSTPHNVQQFQEDLLTAQATEIRSLQRYRTAISALERAQGTLLESRGISVDQEREREIQNATH